MRSLLCLLPLLAGGCLTHIPPGAGSAYIQIDWQPDFAAAREASANTGRPMLLCLAAGDLHHDC
jgi:hypothetical protein